MIKEALEYIIGLREAKVIDVDGEKYLTNSCHKIKKPIVDCPFTTTTLQGVVDYIKNNIDTEIVGNGFTVHIESPSKVTVYSKLNKDRRREILLKAIAIVPNFPTDRYMDAEMFNIQLLSKFVPTDSLRTIMQLAGTIKEGSEQEVADDGITQRVTAKAGIARYEDIEVGNPFKLTPFRTFPEVEQPSSLFIFRIRKGPECALFDCGDTYWRNEAMNGIKEFLTKNLEDCNVNIIM